MPAIFECHRLDLVCHRLAAVNLVVAVRVLHKTHAQQVKVLTWPDAIYGSSKQLISSL